MLKNLKKNDDVHWINFNLRLNKHSIFYQLKTIQREHVKETSNVGSFFVQINSIKVKNNY